MNIESPESFSNDAVCFQNEGTYSTCFPAGILCASVGMNRDGAIIVRPVVSQPSDKVNLCVFNAYIIHCSDTQFQSDRHLSSIFSITLLSVLIYSGTKMSMQIVSLIITIVLVP